MVADALIACAIPRHVDSQRALPVLALHLAELEAIDATAGGVVEHFIEMVRSMVRDRAREHKSARPGYEQLREATRRAAARWLAPRALDARDVERAAASIDVPELTTALLELGLESGEFAPVETLLLALSLRRAVAGTEHERPWRTACTKLASDTIYVLRATALFTLRVELLDALLATIDPRSSSAELYFQRANTRQVIDLVTRLR